MNPTDSRQAFVDNLGKMAARSLNLLYSTFSAEDQRPKGEPFDYNAYYFEKSMDSLRASGDREHYRQFHDPLLTTTANLRRDVRELEKRKLVRVYLQKDIDRLRDKIRENQEHMAMVRRAYWSPEAVLARSTRGLM